MSENSTWKESESGLTIRRESELARIPNGDSSPMSEIISRSLVHIQSSRALAAPQMKAGEERKFEIAPGVSIVMCWIPPGEFLMESPKDDVDRQENERRHFVKITRGYWLAKTQTTQDEWEAVMEDNPSHFRGRNLPVEFVRWNDVCGNESRTGGFLAAINLMASGGERFDLPTEAQWEYAARAGIEGQYPGDLGEIAWYGENSDGMTHPVDQKKSNRWGLHDMLGNVWEWCVSRHDEYPDGAVADPLEPASVSSQALRGGCWDDPEIFPFVAFHFRDYGGYPDYRGSNIGFRLARNLVPSEQPAAKRTEGRAKRGTSVGDEVNSIEPEPTNLPKGAEIIP